MRTSEVAAAVAGRLSGRDVTVSGAAVDSRLVRGGELFVAVVADRDGHDFVGAALAWDLLLGPALALADRLLRRVLPGEALNAVRVPALLSGVLLLVWAPLILSRSEETFERKSGLSIDPYLERWLAVTAVLFAASGLLLAVRLLRRRRAA